MSETSVEDLQQQIADLQAQLTELGHAVQQPVTQPASTSHMERHDAEDGLSRRHLFARAAALTAGVGGVAVAGLVTARHAAAETGTMIYGFSNYAGTDMTALSSTNALATLYLGNSGSGSAILTDSTESTSAVVGRNTGTSTIGVGVRGQSQSGRGGVFRGKAAAIKLQASGRATHPATGQRGDMVVDKSGRLWFCNGKTTWTQLA